MYRLRGLGASTTPEMISAAAATTKLKTGLF